jgi:hypothetical protein
MSHEVQELDVNDPRQVIAYERDFYAAFEPLSENRLIRWLWDWDHTERRLRTRVPYDEQTVFIEWEETGEVRRALAIGTKLRTIQAADYGFEIPKHSENCESLTFFTMGKRDYEGTRRFYSTCRQRLVERGFESIYATGAPRILRLHMFVGGQLLESREIEGEIRNFVRIPVRAARARRKDGVQYRWRTIYDGDP